jgi:hypothetical protein
MPTTQVSDVDNAARNPVQANVRFQINVGSADAIATVFSVPAGKRLVIEHISCEIWLQFDAVPGEFFVATVLNAPPPVSHLLLWQKMLHGPYGISESLRLYAEANTDVEVQAIRDGATTQVATVDVTIAGYLIVLP